MKNISKLTGTEKNKELAYVSAGFKNWKKAPECFKQHQNSKCYNVSATLEIIVPSCGDAVAMMNENLSKSQSEERQYLKVVMECIQYLARQAMALRGNDHVDDNLAQLLLLLCRDNPEIAKRLSAPSTANNRKYTYQDYQNEFLSLMANQVLGAKLNAIRQSKYFSIICDEYSDVSNKEQRSFCVRWIEENLKAIEDFLSYCYYELPNIQSHTIVAAIKDSLISFELPLQNL